MFLACVFLNPSIESKYFAGNKEIRNKAATQNINVQDILLVGGGGAQGEQKEEL